MIRLGKTHRKHCLTLTEVARTFSEIFAAKLFVLKVKHEVKHKLEWRMI